MLKLQKSIFITSFSLVALWANSSIANSTQLTVYAEEYFAADWGPAPMIKASFEQAYPQCQMQIIPFDSSATMLNRVRLEGKNTRADIVIGLDNFQLETAQKTGVFAPHQVDLNQLSLPISWDNPLFLPYDFGQYAFIYDKTKLTNPPQSFQELVQRQDLKVIYQDPRTSSVGRGLIVWANLLFPEDKIEKLWQQLASHTVTVGKGWSETYGAFLKGEADLVMSYNTSPIYHILKDNKDQYAAAVFSDPVLLQIETAAKTIKAKDNDCATQFLQFLLQADSQREISTKNVMMPVTNAEVEPLYQALKQQQMQVKTLPQQQATAEQIKQWINTWQAALIK